MLTVYLLQYKDGKIYIYDAHNINALNLFICMKNNANMVLIKIN